MYDLGLNIELGLSTWGEKWGVPKENDFVLTKVENKNDNVVLYFLEGMKFTIINAVGFELNPMKEKRLKVKSADKIVCEYYYYGKPQTKENLFIIEYTLLDNSRVHVIKKSNYGSRDEIIKVKGKMAISSF